MKETILQINKPYWAIVKSGDVNGYVFGTALVQTALYQFDTASELNTFLGNGSVDSGESMGEYMFKVLALSHENLNALQQQEEQDAQREREQAEYDRLNAEYQNEYMQYLEECTALSFEEWKQQGGC